MVYENVLFVLEVIEEELDVICECVIEVLGFVGFEDCVDVFLSEFLGGE